MRNSKKSIIALMLVLTILSTNLFVLPMVSYAGTSGDAVVVEARKWIGVTPYKWGGQFANEWGRLWFIYNTHI